MPVTRTTTVTRIGHFREPHSPGERHALVNLEHAHLRKGRVVSWSGCA